MTLPTRRPRLRAQRHDAEARALRVAEEQRAREVAAKKVAEAVERDHAHRRRAATPLARGLETTQGWLLSILGALIVSLTLTWLVRHPQVLDSLMSAAWSALHPK